MKIDYLKQVATNILNQEIKENNIDVNYKVLSGNEFDKYRKNLILREVIIIVFMMKNVILFLL